MKRREYPKMVLRKKIIKGTFWAGFTLVAFLSIVAIVRVGNAGADSEAQDKEPQEEKQEVNLTTSVGAQSFAQNFASEYFDWENTDEAKGKRIERLNPYLANGLDQQAGLAFEGMEWNSSLSESQVWNVEETGKDTALITLRVNHTLKKTTQPDSKAVEEAKKSKTEPPKAKEETAGPYEKYFVVPIKTDGKSFVVHKIPYYVAAPTKPKITVDITRNEEGKINDSQLQEQVKTFLDTFFKVYTTGTQDELFYYIKGDSIQSMTGVLTFKEVKDVILKEGDSKTDFTLTATVIYTENNSKAQVVYPYELSIVKGDRWFVKSIKNQ